MKDKKVKLTTEDFFNEINKITEDYRMRHLFGKEEEDFRADKYGEIGVTDDGSLGCIYCKYDGVNSQDVCSGCEERNGMQGFYKKPNTWEMDKKKDLGFDGGDYFTIKVITKCELLKYEEEFNKTHAYRIEQWGIVSDIFEFLKSKLNE